MKAEPIPANPVNRDARQLDLGLFPGLELGTTPSLDRGSSFLDQCAHCGLLVCVPRKRTPKRPLKACPDCGCCHWWAQQLPVGPFEKKRKVKAAKPRAQTSPEPGR